MLLPNDGQAEDQFGYSVAIDDTLGGKVALKNHIAMLGVSRRDVKGENSGSVYAFERDAGTWSQKQILTAVDAKAGDAFGQSIALTERFLVIGAPHSGAPQKDSGSAYVYIRHNNTWQFQAKLTANDGTIKPSLRLEMAQKQIFLA